MKKFIIALVASLASLSASATKYVSECATGTPLASVCVAGSSGNNGTAAATPKLTSADFKTQWQALTAGEHILVANGSATAGTFTGLLNTNGIGTPLTASVTISNASPAVVTWTGHGLVADREVTFRTNGALPSPLVVGRRYYVISAGLGANSFEISATLAGSAINTTTAGSGTHKGVARRDVIIDTYVPSWMPAVCTAGTTGTVTGATLTTLTDGAATFNTTGTGLAGCAVNVVIPASGRRPRTEQQFNIASNTATQVTLDVTAPVAGWSRTPPTGTTYTIVPPYPKIIGTPASAMMSWYKGSVAADQGHALYHHEFDGSVAGVAISSLVVSGSTATVTANSHGLANGQYVTVTGSSLTGSNKSVSVSGVTTNTFNYSCSGCTAGTSSGTPIYYHVALWGMLIGQNSKYNIMDHVYMHGMNVITQCNGNTTGHSISGDGLSSHLTITDSMVTYAGALGVLTSCRDTRIENVLFDHCGASIFDHCFYYGGMAQDVNAVTVDTLSGDGTTVTATTSTAHGIPTDKLSLVTVSNASDASFNVTGARVTVTSATTFTYPRSATGTATGATYTVSSNMEVTEGYVRNSTILNANFGAAGQCGEVAGVVHGAHLGFIAERNWFEEATVPASSCFGMAISNGNYGAPESQEYFKRTIVRDNTFINYGTHIHLDNCQGCFVATNYIRSAVPGAHGIRAPIDTQAKIADAATNTDLTVANNTIVLSASTTTSIGVDISREGSNHRIVSNLIYFGGSGGNCFVTDAKSSGTVHSDSTYWLTPGAFSAIDNNLCFGFTNWAWNQGATYTLAQQRTWGSLVIGFDTNSVNCNPAFTDITSGPELNAGSCALGAGHPTLSSLTSSGGILRSSTPDIGAHQRGATATVPLAPTRIAP